MPHSLLPIPQSSGKLVKLLYFDVSNEEEKVIFKSESLSFASFFELNVTLRK